MYLIRIPINIPTYIAHKNVFDTYIYEKSFIKFHSSENVTT